jgi:hypothetical protein
LQYAATALVILGFMVGILCRFRVLLTAVGIVLVASIGFSVASDFRFLAAFATVMAAQAILQGSYFMGLITKAAVSAHRERTRQALRRHGDQPCSDTGTPRLLFSLLEFLTL